jgi:hypothetical protein
MRKSELLRSHSGRVWKDRGPLLSDSSLAAEAFSIGWLPVWLAIIENHFAKRCSPRIWSEL